LNCSRTVREAFKKDRRDSGILDFDARVPIPFSVFPSSYRRDATTEPKVQVEAKLELTDQASRVGREGHEGRYQTERFERKERFEEPSRYSRETVRIQDRLPEERVTRRVQVTRDR
jgi:hypothetical protein